MMANHYAVEFFSVTRSFGRPYRTLFALHQRGVSQVKLPSERYRAIPLHRNYSHTPIAVWRDTQMRRNLASLAPDNKSLREQLPLRVILRISEGISAQKSSWNLLISQQVLNPTPPNPTPATWHKRKRKLHCSFRNAALQKLHCNIGFSAVRMSF